MKAIAGLAVGAALCAACSPSAQPAIASKTEQARLPTGARLDPAGSITDVGSFPLAMVPSPDRSKLVLLLNGYREQGIQIVDRATGAVTQTIHQPAAFIGVAFSPDGKRLYTSGGNEDAIFVYDWINGRANAAGRIQLAEKRARQDGTRYPAGLGLSPDGSTLYATENLADSLAVVDTKTRTVVDRLPAGRYPYGVAVSRDGIVYVSSWGESSVSVFKPTATGLGFSGKIETARHPSALLLNRDGSRLFVASASTDQISIVDTRNKRVSSTINAQVPGIREGSTPNAFALSPDEKRLYVAEADNNAVSVVDVSSGAVIGRIPAGWYPAAVYATADSLFVINAKGRGTGPNPRGPLTPYHELRQYTLAQTSGTVMSMGLPQTSSQLTEYSARVARANGWDSRERAAYPPIQHVLYIIKENRTYDQILGDLPQADGDRTLVFFGRRVTPNHHALAERFGIFDRFFVNAEVSADGHNWSVGAYVTDYTEKTVPSNYSSRGRTYDYEGTNRDAIPDDDVAEPAAGYLWSLAEKAGISFRNYGEFVADIRTGNSVRYRGTKPYLAAHTNENYPGYDLGIEDQRRVDVWLKEFHEFESKGEMPALEIIRLPSDHTSGASAGSHTPRAHLADNDYALGRIIEALSRSRFWEHTAVFVLEDDAQNGPDHVDSHRSPMLVISPWTKGGVVHRFTNTTDVLATMEELLGLGNLSQFDHYGRPLRDIWASKADSRPYVALRPSVSLEERNPSTGKLAEESKKLALSKEDIADEDLFNRILWKQLKGSRPYPGVKRMPAWEVATPR